MQLSLLLEDAEDEFKEGDRVTGYRVTNDLTRGSRITGTVAKVGNRYLKLTNGAAIWHESAALV